MSNKILDELARRPYRLADLLEINPATIFRWMAYLKGNHGSYRPCRPQKHIRERLARTLGVPLAELEEAFAVRNMAGGGGEDDGERETAISEDCRGRRGYGGGGAA